MSGRLPMDGLVASRELVRMDGPRSRLPDEVHGARAAGSLLVGDLAESEAELACVRTRYLVGFLLRLALVVPDVSSAPRLARRCAAAVQAPRPCEVRAFRSVGRVLPVPAAVTCVRGGTHSHTTPSPSPSRMYR